MFYNSTTQKRRLDLEAFPRLAACFDLTPSHAKASYIASVRFRNPGPMPLDAEPYSVRYIYS